MIRPFVKNPLLLQQASEAALPSDRFIGEDLQDTLRAHQEECVGMAANMIGLSKRIIIVNIGVTDLLLYNPILLRKSHPYTVEEGCLSLSGSRSTIRYKEICVRFFNHSWQEQTMEFTGLTAQIIQHELDHLEGILI